MQARPFLVNVAALRRHPGRALDAERAGPIPGLAVTSARVPEDADVAVDVTLESVQSGVMVHGTVSAPWVGECRRCLRTATGELETEVRELFEPENDPEETYRLTGDQLDLEPLARDAVLLELPQAPLCHEGCRGLCPTCGADRNEVVCGCADEVGDPRWAALDALRND